MPHFSDDYFRDLPPRDRRYDTPVADQLVFSVFPNGVKAWVHVYPCGDFVRRRTMGLFPEMGYQTALATLEESRRIAEVDAMEIRGPRPAGGQYRKYAGVALAAAALAAALTYLLTRGDPSEEAPADAVSPPAVATPSADAGESPSGSDTPPDETDIENSPEEPAATADVQLPEVADRADPVAPLPGAEADVKRLAATPPADQPAETGAAAATEPAGSMADDAGDPTADTGASSLTVARALLTTDVRDHEPADELSGTFRRPQEDPFRIYFFTELTGRPGDSVTHRWQRDGVTVAERRFSIGDGARWRVFSSKYIPPAGAGEWQAMVIDGTGRVIETRTLEIVTGP